MKIRRRQGPALDSETRMAMVLCPEYNWSTIQVEEFARLNDPGWVKWWLGIHHAWVNRPDERETIREFHERLSRTQGEKKCSTLVNSI